MELYLIPYGHTYGPMVLNILGICADIQRQLVIKGDVVSDSSLQLLHIFFIKYKFYETCPPNCACNQPQDWRSGSVSLTALEVIEIENFGGSGPEIDLLKPLFRCAPLLKRATVKPRPNTLPSIRACKEICGIFKKNASVKCYAYDSWGKKVLYARSTYASRCSGR
ncbi:hypothetical protein BAE44_0019352 [Dichanthelium oligosanthes]|uniref:FBD domain-containing protein n=1 Tax=Dichanthelium oligosanthes TaxID=888268 RepID=A0A1E5V397_9POAL|nr:hypothetical protein BAE44_0019352 [Dichanthelium oligosanthes]